MKNVWFKFSTATSQTQQTLRKYASKLCLKTAHKEFCSYLAVIDVKPQSNVKLGRKVFDVPFHGLFAIVL